MAVLPLRVFWRRRMFAAMRRPASRRFAGETLRATMTGSDAFIAATSYRSVVTGPGLAVTGLCLGMAGMRIGKRRKPLI